MIQDGRTGRNIRHEITGLPRQSVYARLAGYEDVNDQELLLRDPAMRAVVGKKALERNAAGSQTLSRFETETLAADENLAALSSINHAWAGKAMRVTGARRIILDMDSSESPVHGNQEGSEYDGHFCSRRYHPLFVFNQYGDCEGAHLRPATSIPPMAGGTCWSPWWTGTWLQARSSTSGETPPSPRPRSTNTWRRRASSTP